MSQPASKEIQHAYFMHPEKVIRAIQKLWPAINLTDLQAHQLFYQFPDALEEEERGENKEGESKE